MNKNYLLYIGIFLAGAIITPLYLSVFNGNGGDRPEADGESSDEINLDLTANSESFSTDQDAGKIFVPNDSQEVILNDYPAVKSKPVPTGFPEYARNQPSVAPYPNYRTPQIPSFTTTQFSPDSKLPKSKPSVDPSLSVTIKPQNAGSSTFQLPADAAFIPPRTIPNLDADSPASFGGSFQVSDDFVPKDVTGSSTNPTPSDGATDSESL